MIVKLQSSRRFVSSSTGLGGRRTTLTNEGVRPKLNTAQQHNTTQHRGNKVKYILLPTHYHHTASHSVQSDALSRFTVNCVGAAGFNV